MAEKHVQRFESVEDNLRHSIVKPDGDFRALPVGECRVAQVNRIGYHSLDPFDAGQPAGVGNVGRFRRPWRNRAGTRSHNLQEPFFGGGGAAGPVREKFFKHTSPVVRELAGQFGDVDKFGPQTQERNTGGGEILLKFLQAKVGEGGRAAKNQHGEVSL